MKIIDFSPERAEPITRYESVDAHSVPLADGRGEAHVHCIRFGAGGRIGPHPTGFGQLFVVVEGRGWVEGREGRRREIAAGEAAWFERGEHHAKGSDHGMTAVMIQVGELEPRVPRSGEAP
jgi:quercetin dioxygenase-like cupin family protein